MSLLHPATEVRAYCGPTALVAVSGESIEQIKARVNAVRDRRPTAAVLGMGVVEMEQVLGRMHQFREFREFRELLRLRTRRRPTLLDFVDGLPVGHQCRVVICTSDHFVAYGSGTVVDSFIRRGCPVEAHPYRRARVKWAMAVIR